METNPYQLRFDILTMAKDLLMEEWHAKRMAVETEWHSKIDYQKQIGGHELIPFPSLPSAPSVERIKELATELNAFVSRKS
jgi:hypothetical protein